MFATLLVASCATTPAEPLRVPTGVATWGELASLVTPTAGCPGGTVEALTGKLAVSPDFGSANAYSKATREPLPRLAGVRAGDSFHQFTYRQEFVDGGFSGYGGFLLARGGCIIHAQLTSVDN